ncbi:MAG: c-type cytochrome [Candidatus Thiodiazotropha sp.]
MNRLAIYCLGCLLATGSVLADEPVFRWDRATLKLVASGDATRGQAIAKEHKCKKCHGKTGVSEEDDTPSIAGQVPTYQFKQLMDYKSGVRDEKTMTKRARKLTREDMADLAAFYATQTPEDGVMKTVPKLVEEGDMSRLLLPCSVCHGKKGEGLGFEVPALAGQKIEHFIETMEAFQEGDRENDEYGRMRFIAQQLSEDEIAELAAFYSAPPAPEED